jgi:hypothetical protein
LIIKSLTKNGKKLEDTHERVSCHGTVALWNRTKAKVLGYGQSRECSMTLRCKRYAAPNDILWRKPMQLLSAEDYPARVETYESCNCSKKARFACAVSAEQCDYLAFLDP